MAANETVSDALRKARAEMINKMATLTKTEFNLASFSGMEGPKGVCGEPGTPGRNRYFLVYCGITFPVELMPETFDMIEDATSVNGDELAFIKVINEDEWKRIRGAWAQKWQQNKAFEAFEMGDPCGDDWIQ